MEARFTVGSSVLLPSSSSHLYSTVSPAMNCRNQDHHQTTWPWLHRCEAKASNYARPRAPTAGRGCL